MLGAVICRLAPLGTISGIAVVDSGSSDRTLEVVDRFATTSVVPVRLVGCSAPGWPAAALRGVRTSQARWVGFAGSHDTLPAALGHAIALLRQGYHIVIGEPARPAAAGRRGPGKLRLTRFRGRRVPTRSGRSRSIGVCDRAVADLILEDLAPHWSGSDIELLDDGRYLGLRTAEIGAADPDREGWWPH